MARDVVSAKLDIIFKKMFTDNKDLLHDFVADMLDIPSKDIGMITVMNPEIPPETISGKFSRLDLSMTVGNRLVNVEIQVKNDTDFRDRALFYWAKLYTSDLKSGEAYGSLKQTFSINIINFNMFDGADFHTEIVPVIKGTQEIFSDKFSIHFFELKKVNKRPNPNNRRELWLQFLNADSEEDFEMLKQTKVPTIEKAVNVIYDMSEDTRIREMARMREKTLHDEASALKNAKDEGRAEGVSQMIGKLRKRGFSEEEIQAIIDESLD